MVALALRITIGQDGAAPWVVVLEARTITIGRRQHNDLVLSDHRVSSVHARVIVSGDAIVIDDLSSENGTFVNGRRIDGPTRLRPGDEITIGSHRLAIEALRAKDDVVAPTDAPTRGVPAPIPEPQAESRPEPHDDLPLLGTREAGIEDDEAMEDEPLEAARGLDARPAPIVTPKPVRRSDARPTAPPERRVNTGFSALRALDPWPRDRPLEPARSYLFWLEIGPQVLGAIDRHAIRLPDEVPDGALIEVVLFGEPGGFETADAVGRLVLHGARGRVRDQPTLRDLSHAGTLVDRRLFFDVTTPAEPGVHHLSCNLYHRGVLLQSIDVSARVVQPGTVEVADGPALSASLQQALSPWLTDAVLQANREHVLSIVQGRDRGDGTHTFQFFGEHTARGHVQLDDHEVQNLLDMARKTYREVSWGSDAPYDPARPNEFHYRYEAGGDYGRLEQDLGRLARVGFRLWARVAHRLAQVHDSQLDRWELRRRMLAPNGRIQLGLRHSPRRVLPLAAFYDHPLAVSTSAHIRLCPTFKRTLHEDPLETPCFREQCEHHDDQHTVCPSGFWGFRHSIGLTPSMTHHDPCPVIELGAGPILHAILWAGSDLRLRDAHIDALRHRFPGAALQVAEHRRAAIELLEHGGSPLIYFYCHGGANDFGPYLRVGTPHDDPIEPADLANLPRPWISPQPLVIINGCHTTNLEPERAFEFVSALVEQGAVGVLGTEITVFEPLATRFGESFLERFCGGADAGDAVRLARLELLGRSLDPLGLLYVPFMLSTVRLSTAA